MHTDQPARNTLTDTSDTPPLEWTPAPDQPAALSPSQVIEWARTERHKTEAAKDLAALQNVMRDGWYGRILELVPAEVRPYVKAKPDGVWLELEGALPILISLDQGDLRLRYELDGVYANYGFDRNLEQDLTEVIVDAVAANPNGAITEAALLANGYKRIPRPEDVKAWGLYNKWVGDSHINVYPEGSGLLVKLNGAALHGVQTVQHLQALERLLVPGMTRYTDDLPF